MITTAILVCEGALPAEGDTPEERAEYVLACWQQLIDDGALSWLQGCFGRTAADLIERGLCSPPSAS